MAQKPQKKVVHNIVKNLLDSEIPEIQAVAKELVDRTKQLEEHSWKLQHYATEIESLSVEETAEVQEEASLAELVKDLEKTLSQLREKPVDTAATVKEVAEAEGETKTATKEIPEAKVEKKATTKEVTKAKVEPKAEVREKPELTEVEEVRKEGGGRPREDVYTTPEGFVVRRAHR